MPQRLKLDTLEKIRFIDGTMKHLVFQMVLLETGILKAIEGRVDIPKYRLWGHVDGEGDGWGFELKSTQAFGYYAENGPSLAHRLQVHTYFMARPDWKRFSVVYWDTRSREWKEFILKRDPQYIKMVRDELEALNDCIDHRYLPEVLSGCRKRSGQEYKRCAYSHLCLGCKDYEEAEANGQAAQAQDVSIRRRTPTNKRNSGRVVRVRRRIART